MKKEKNLQMTGIVMTLAGGVLWGFCGSCGQYLFQYKEVTSGWLVPLRLTFAGLLILVLLACREKGRVLDVWRERQGRRDILIFSVFGMMLCQYSYFTTIQYSNAGTATVLQYTGPALILVYLCIRDRKKPRAYELAALFCSMFGTFILATHGNISELAIPAEALLWGMISAVTLVIYTLQPAGLMKRYSTLLTLGWGMLIGGLVLMLLMRPWTLSPVVDRQTVLAMSFIVLFGTICAFYFYLTGVKLVGASSASMLACIEPVAATVISVVWLKVRFRMIDLLGFVFVLSTVFIISLNQKKEDVVRQGERRLQHG
ncbi:MAG: EamA family transporter [Lachnospiraceae bacterium]|nr:EamA family transporter [Lachnospiraceae bacterium]